MSLLDTNPVACPLPAAASPVDARARPFGLRAIGSNTLTRHWGLATAAGLLLCWLLLAMTTDSALMGDNIEQTIWAHSFEWGYYKHPPLPTWILMSASSLFGNPWWLTDLLAGLCLLGTALATYALALRLTNRHTAQLAMLLWGLHLTLTWRVGLYNHNTVLILFCALLAWSVVTATQKKSMHHWALAGLFAGLALLSKYQVIVLLAVLFLSTARGNYLVDPLHRKGIMVATGVAAAVFAPHFVWLLQNDFLPLHYASTHFLEEQTMVSRIATVLSFMAQQLRLFWPALALTLIVMLRCRKKIIPQDLGDNAPNSSEAIKTTWIRFLTFGPTAIVLLVGLTGTKLQNHWGLQTMQFVSLGLAAWITQRRFVKARLLVAITGCLQLVLLVTQLQSIVSVREFGWQGQNDNSYPARQVAQQALAHWQRETNCPLKYVVGPSFEAGSIALFSGQDPLVFEGGSQIASPWINSFDLEVQGALYISHSPENLLGSETTHGKITLTDRGSSKRPRTIYWSVVAPADSCDVG